MIWKKLKKLIIPLVIIKLVFLGFFIFNTDFISISRDVTYNSGIQEGFDNDSLYQKKQKLIRIVRNKDDRGIMIQLRGKKKDKPLINKEEELSIPIVD